MPQVSSELIYVIITAGLITGNDGKISTACYGTVAPCNRHVLSCNGNTVIEILNTTYGYRSQCNNINGLVGCADVSCCIEEPGDCFKLFLSEQDVDVKNKCDGKSFCRWRSVRKYDASGQTCGQQASSYSKIEYDCVEADILSSTPGNNKNTPPSVSSINIGAIVGGVIGSILIIIIIVIGIIFFLKRKNKVLKSPDVKKDTDKSEATPHYFELEKNKTLQSNDVSQQPTDLGVGYEVVDLDEVQHVPSTGDYDYVKDDNFIIHPTQTTVDSDDNYNKIGEDNSVKPRPIDTNYNQINQDTDYSHMGEENSVQPLDIDYTHIGNDPVGEYNELGEDNSVRPSVINTNYNHVNISNTDYNVLGEELNQPPIIKGDYTHIGDITQDTDYSHIGESEQNPIVTDNDYSHIH